MEKERGLTDEEQRQLDDAISGLIEAGKSEKYAAVPDNGGVRQVKKPERLKSISAVELASLNIPPMEFLVKNLIPAVGLTMLGAPAKSYKSYWCIDMSLCIAEGCKFLGFDTKKSEVLYLDLESTRRRPKDRIRQIAGDSIPSGFYLITGEERVLNIGEGLSQQLEWQLEEHPNIGIIIIDVLKKIRSSSGRGKNDYDRDYDDLGALKGFADAHNICILVVHHTRKMKDLADPFNELTGSSGVMGTLDCALVICKDKREDKEARLYITGRDLEEQCLKIAFDKKTYKWKNLGNAEDVEHDRMIEEYRNSRVVKTIKKLMEQHDGYYTGSASDIISASQFFKDCTIYDSATKVGIIIVNYIGLFDEVDAISVKKEGYEKRRRYTFENCNPYKTST